MVWCEATEPVKRMKEKQAPHTYGYVHKKNSVSLLEYFFSESFENMLQQFNLRPNLNLSQYVPSLLVYTSIKNNKGVAHQYNKVQLKQTCKT